MAKTFSLSDIFGPPKEPETFSLEEIFGQSETAVPAPEPGIGAERRAARTGVDNRQEQADVFDPFAGESFSDIARRRGQQFARGAGEVAASVPEAVAIGQSGLEMRNRDAAQGQLDERAETIRNFEAILERPDLSDQQRDYYQAQLDAYRQGQEVLEGQRAAEVVSAQKRDLFQQGDTIRQGVEDIFGAPDPRDTSFWASVAEGAGNMTALAALSLVGPSGVALSAGAGSGMNTSQVYREAIDAGADEETALRAAKFAAGIGATEIIPITRALKALPPRLRPKITNGVLQRFADTAQGATEEAAQEYLAQVANNIVAQNLYDGDRGWNEGAAEGALVGAVLGGGMGLVGSYMSPDRQPTASRPPSIPGGSEEPDQPNQPPTPTAGTLVTPPSTPPAPDMPPAPARLDQPETRRAPTLPEMPENLKPGDAESPVPNDILSAGRNVMDAIERGEPIPMPPQPLPDALPQGLGEATGPALQTNVQPPAQAREAPTAPPLPTDLPASPRAADVPPAQDTTSQVPERAAPENVTDWMPEVDVDADGVETETGRLIRVNLDTNEPEIFGQEATPETPQNAEPSPAVPVDAPEVEATTGEVPDGVEATQRVSPRVGGIEVLANEDLTSIETDAETFQYKSGGDAEGVTDRLLGVKRWETPRAGQAIVYEYNDGRRVIADGHQRIGLAKRLRAEGQDVAMPVTIRREADGFTPEDVMVEAALKNISESSAINPDDTAVIDAAKVLRAQPDALPKLNLPQGEKSALGRNAKTLTALSPDAFGMVVNERASMRSALAVAKAVPDQAAQANILNVVEKSGARNAFEAEQVARQAAADTVVQTQDSLFGSEEVTETLYLERARVMDQAIKRLRKEAGAFKTILRNSGNIEAVGDNRVDRDASERRASEDAVAQEYITRLANSKGPISEALTEAARSVKAGGDTGQAVTGFVKAVRAGLSGRAGTVEAFAQDGAANEQAGSTTESAGQDGLPGLTETAAQGRSAAEAAPDALSDTPVATEEQGSTSGSLALEPTDAGDQTLIPGVEPITQADRNQAEIQTRAEAPMQGGQTPGQQGGRGDLFGDPAERGDLFDQAPEAPSQQYEPLSRTERRLFNALRDEWTARESLPDTEEGNAAFVAATEKVSAARRAFADEYGQNKVNAALKRIEAEYQPQDVAASGRNENNKPDDTQPRERIEDFGEKIGGARKDTATPTGPRPTRKKDERPASQSNTGQETRRTLEDYAPKSDRRQEHVYAEHGGRRYYIGSYDNQRAAQAAVRTQETSERYRGASFFTTDRADSTSINGDASALRRAVQQQAQRRADRGGLFDNGDTFKFQVAPASARGGPVSLFEKSAQFSAWFGDSKAVNENGEPLILYHGSTADFDAFDRARANPESDFGAGFYFSNTPADVAANYAGFGPDLTLKMERAAERIADELSEERGREYSYDDPEVKALARDRFAAHDGMSIPVYLSLQNPVVIDGPRSTYIESGVKYETEPFMDDAREELRDEYGDESFDAFEVEERAREMAMENGYESVDGGVLGMIEALHGMAARHEFLDIDANKVSEDLVDMAVNGVRAGALVDALKASEGLVYAVEPERGDMASGEIIRRMFEAVGFDGIIDRSVDQKFGSQRALGTSMRGMHSGTTHYIAFRPEQIKSVFNSGAFDPADARFLFQAAYGNAGAAPMEMFYSPLLKAVSSAKQKQAPAKDWKAIVAKLGVKKAELEWLGVDEWLDTQEGQVPREALVAFIRDSQIEVVETRLAGEAYEPSIRIEDGDAIDPDTDFLVQNAGDILDDVIEDMALDQGVEPSEIDRDEAFEEALVRAEADYWDDPEIESRVFDANSDWETTAIWNGVTWFADGEVFESTVHLYEWAEEQALKNSDAPEADGEAQFSEYTESGGENYREILLRVPNLHESGKNEPKMGADAASNMIVNEAAHGRSMSEIRQIYDDPNIGKRPFVQSAHFEQENIVVHSRVKDRTGANGEKVLFVEEIQSDLASVWRENQEDPSVTARRRELREQIASAISDRDAALGAFEGAVASIDGAPEVLQSLGPIEAAGRAVGEILVNNTAEVKSVLDRINKDEFASQKAHALLQARSKVSQLQSEQIALGTEKRIPEGTPDTPFKEEATYTLMVKRLLREAAENGYDRLSWTPGYMQAERWNNAAQSVVEDVRWEAAPEGTGAAKRVVIGYQGAENVLMVSSAGVVSGAAQVDGKLLSSILGPQVAKQIMEEDGGAISGQKITFPDSGYAIAYDQQIKKAVDKFAKKYGARVRMDKTLPDMGAEPLKIQSGIEGLGEGNPVWSIDITPELREAAMEPMAMFKRPDWRMGTGHALHGNLAHLRALLDKMNLKQVDLEIMQAPDPNFQGALRIDRKGGMTVLIGASIDPENTLRHEAIHALRAMNLFTEHEWNKLSRDAEGWIKKHDIEARYPDLSYLEQIEEAIAEEYAARAGEQSGPFGKIKRFLEALREFLVGRGFQSVDDVFDMVSEGDIGLRQGAEVSEGMFYQRPALKPAAAAAAAQASNTPHMPNAATYNAAVGRSKSILRRMGRSGARSADVIDSARVLSQDRMIKLRRAVEATEDHYGFKATAEQNPYNAEERFAGQVGRRLEDLYEQYTYPIGKMIARAGKSLSLTDHMGETRELDAAVSLYLWARHAKERNALVAKRMGQGPDMFNPNPAGEGSGLTDAQADAIMAQVKTHKHRKIFETVGNMTDKLGREMIDWRVEAGLLSQDEARQWKAMFKHYVPLTGFAETDSTEESVGPQMPGARGRRFNVKGKEGKSITGRKSEAFDALSNLTGQSEEVIVRGEKNRFMNSVIEFVEAYPAPTMWEIIKPATKKVYNRTTGRIETRLQNPAQQAGPNDIAGKVNGEEVWIRLNDKGLQRALGQVGTSGLPKGLVFMSKFSRYFSAVNTMLSPGFILVNAFRDMLTAQINLSTLPPEIRGKVRKKAGFWSPDYWKSFAGALEGQKHGGGQSQWAQYYREFEESGARVNFWNIEDPQAQRDRLKKVVNLESGNALARALKKGTKLNTDDNPALMAIERLNMAVDNAIRLSVFVEARNQGLSDAEAATLSKNLTVNFNRRGELGAVLNAFFTFANAGIQGTHILAKTLKDSGQARGIFVASVLVAMGLEMLNAEASEEDEDGELSHDKIPNYISERNLILPTGDTRVTIPLPYGYSVPFYAGQQMMKAMRGVKPADEVMKDVSLSVFNNFSPISGNDAVRTITPTALQPVIDIYTNTDWLGRPIRPYSQYNDYGPKSEKYWNVPQWLPPITSGLNRATGGDAYSSGWWDWSPEHVHHVLQFLGGGAGRFVDRTVDVTTKLATGNAADLEGYQIPIVRSFRYKPSSFLDQNRYFEFREGVQSANWEAKQRDGMGVSERVAREAGLYGALRAAEKQRRAITDQINDVYANPNLTDQEQRDRVRPLMDRRAEVYKRFNRVYVEAMGPQAE